MRNYKGANPTGSIAGGLTSMRTCLLLLCLLPLVSRAQDDDNVRPPVSKADIEIVKRARRILDSPAKWNRTDTRDCPPTEKLFSLYCALEKATDEVSGNFEHRGAAMQEARFVIDGLVPNNQYEHRLMYYNNDPKTTFADVQKFFDLLEADIAKRLAEQPQGAAAAPIAEQIAILKRARALLDSEARWDRADTQECAAQAVKVGLYCAFVRAAADVTGKQNASGAAIDLARAIIGSTAPNRDKYQARLIDFNHDPTVKFADIQNLFQQIEERLTKQLAEPSAK